jgi:hypothetical protein
MNPLARKFSLSLCLGAVLLLAGCSDDPNAKLETSIDFVSMPSNAVVKVEGADIGLTPTSATLARDSETHVTISKPGFVTADIYVHPEGGVLKPNPVNVKLKSELLPDSPGPDPQAALARSLQLLQQYLEMDRIAPSDEPYAEAQIRAFFNTPPAK